jgi:dynein heavy chain
VYDEANKLLEKLPENYVEDDYKAKLQKLGGFNVPLNIFLFQEIQRLQRVISKASHVHPHAELRSCEPRR